VGVGTDAPADEEEDLVPEIRYHRMGDLIELKIKGMTNHEIRTVILGLWLRLDRADRVDFIGELQHYLTPGSTLPELARIIGEAKVEA